MIAIRRSSLAALALAVTWVSTLAAQQPKTPSTDQPPATAPAAETAPAADTAQDSDTTDETAPARAENGSGEATESPSDQGSRNDDSGSGDTPKNANEANNNNNDAKNLNQDSESAIREIPDPKNMTPDQAAIFLLQESGGVPNQFTGEQTLLLNFRGTPWKDVLEFIAEEADLAKQFDVYPPGSVNYIDRTKRYTLRETLDVLNRLLIDRGYALVRRNRMLFLIDLEKENANMLISEQAELITMEELDDRGRSEIVSVVFPLGGSMTPDQAREQLNEMRGPWGRVIVLDSARQAKVTETVAKLLAIRKMISDSEQEVYEMALEHRGAEENPDARTSPIGSGTRRKCK